MMSQKVLVFGREDLAEKIMATADPKTCKDIAKQKFPEYNEAVWRAVKYRVVKRGVLEKAGLIPENYFLFFEEMEWCLQIRKKGYKLGTVLTAAVYHKGSATLKKTGTLSRYYMARNQALFVRRNGTTLDLCTFLLTDGLGYVFRCIFSSRRELRKMELSAFLEGMRMDKMEVPDRQ